MNKTVIYPGTFDPITNGHLEMIERTSALFSRVVVAVANSPSKKPLIALADRERLVIEATQHLPNVEVVAFSGLLADLAQQLGAVALVRGLRNAVDMDYEIQLAQLNHQLATGLQTILLPPSVEWRYLSSTMVREIFYHQGDVSPFVPACVQAHLRLLRGG